MNFHFLHLTQIITKVNDGKLAIFFSSALKHSMFLKETADLQLSTPTGHMKALLRRCCLTETYFQTDAQTVARDEGRAARGRGPHAAAKASLS